MRLAHLLISRPVEGEAQVQIARVAVEQVRPLRHVVLRAGLPPEAAIFDGDEEPTSRHLAAIDGADNIVGCATIVRRAWNNEPAWQLRGMAVADSHRGTGVGRLLLQAIETIALTEQFSCLFWCNARTPAVGFYRRAGWTSVGDEFIIQTAGPHYRMYKRISEK
jgi:predicted GNAT family N-acyltransferase